MDMEEIRYLLGGTVFARAKAYTDRIQDLNCEVAGKTAALSAPAAPALTTKTARGPAASTSARC